MIVPRSQPQSRDVSGHYDELDRVYREVWGEHVHHGYWRSGDERASEAVDALVDLVGERMEPEAGQHFCDIGCGYGATAERLATSYDVEVTGLTISQEQHARAEQRTGSVRFLLRDWLHNDLAEQSFDGAYAIESTEHMSDKERCFAEAHRVTKPGGKLVICAWLASESARSWEIRHLLEPICREGQLPGMGTREEYVDFAARAGFELLSFEDISRQVRRTWDICLLRLMKRLATDSSYRKLVTSSETRNRSFALSLPRLMLAYRTGAMRYGLFTFARPATEQGVRGESELQKEAPCA
ncbi:class I SAM-dependent methyltransferase [Qipengyuania sp. DY56-A-20]|jgi:tocopherol O-methyltransferase|uniref:Class I SAM-dependent methyltransferase n=1 Tax=Qipengyuania benthica TaxID=3067651 RepID=A0ABT9HAN4_9SPHN|nr:class I SAM-dependent methyltransferase [Qipengyuania sp. DY56-A-20]MDP4540391.1 class I SAM-dependent methyltransferase [Qipengyuania sp. DY56-A-20]